MFDAWTSKSYDLYLTITAHYIDSPPDQPYEWQLKSKVLGFEELRGRHSGENMATMISEVLDGYDIKDKVRNCVLYFWVKLNITQLGWATADNATTNDKALCSLDRNLNTDRVFLKKWTAQDRRVRYAFFYVQNLKAYQSKMHGTYHLPCSWRFRQSNRSKDQDMDQKLYRIC